MNNLFPLPHQLINEKKHTECEKCGWPICSRSCQNNINHAHNECKLTVDRGSKVWISMLVEALLQLQQVHLYTTDFNQELWVAPSQLQLPIATPMSYDEGKQPG